MGNDMLNNLEKDVKLMISGMTGLKPEEISPDAHLYNELGIDSIKGIELAVALQEKYSIRVKDSRISQLTTVKLVVEEIKGLLDRKT